jgi:hypothetical protein
MWMLARLRYTLARRPYLYWLFAGTCALLIATRLHRVEASAEHAAAAWGTSRTVWVNDGDAAPGAPLHPVLRRYPTAVVPRAAVATVQADVRAAHAVADGQVLVAADIAGARTPPADWVVLALPADHAPATVPGDSVAVLHAGAFACDGTVTVRTGTDHSGAASHSDALDVAMPVACAASVSADLSSVVVARRAAPTYGATDERP